MIKIFNRLLLIFLCLCLPLTSYSAEKPIKSKPAEIEKKEISKEELKAFEATLSSLELLINSKQEKNKEIEKTLKKLKRRSRQIKQKQADKSIDAMQQELKDLEHQLEVTITGISQKEYESKVTKKFNLQEELEMILQPLVHALKSATQDSRKIEQLRQQIDLIKQKLKIATTVVKRIDSLQKTTSDKKILKILNSLFKEWSAEEQELKDELVVFNNILANKLAGQESVMVATSTIFIDFFKHRGLHLFFGLAALAAVLALSFLLKMLYRKIPFFYHSDERSTFARLLGLIYFILTFILAFMAMLFIFNYFNDWLLVGFSILLMIAIIWVFLKSLPVVLEQVTLLLNLGSVREGERILYNDIPWKVERLSFYSKLRNPVLTGGTLQVSSRELVGMVTREISKKEAWFPSKEGDWVKLENEVIGQVKYQSPEMVEIEDFGQSRITYSAQTYLSLNPMNLSKGYRIQTLFGIDYRHQKIMLTTIPELMFEVFYQDLKDLLGKEEIKRVTTDFWMAGDSALQYEYEAYIKGSSAHMFEEVERVIIYAFGKVCNEYNIVIPFPQITYHKGDPV